MCHSSYMLLGGPVLALTIRNKGVKPTHEMEEGACREVYRRDMRWLSVVQTWKVGRSNWNVIEAEV